METKELFVPYKESLMLKNLGFNEPCFAVYSLGLEEDNYNQLQFHIDYSQAYGDRSSFIPIENNFFAIRKRNSDYGHAPTAPLFYEAFEWFRVKYNSWIEIRSGWYFVPYINGEIKQFSLVYKTYKEAELDGLRFLIENIKTTSTYSNGIPLTWE